MDRNDAAFLHLSTVFPDISAAKLKEDLLVGPRIREVVEDTNFEEFLNLKELKP